MSLRTADRSRPFALRVIPQGRLRWNKRWTSWPSGFTSILSRSVTKRQPSRTKEQRQRAASAFGWASRTATGQGKRSGKLGEVPSGQRHGRRAAGNHLVNMDSSAEVRIHRDGSAEVLTGVQDIGSGIRTPLAGCRRRASGSHHQGQSHHRRYQLATGSRLERAEA